MPVQRISIPSIKVMPLPGYIQNETLLCANSFDENNYASAN